MGPLDLVQLTPLMRRTNGRPEIGIGLIDGPAALNLPDLAAANIREVPGKLKRTCSRADTVACSHGTFVTAILVARRGSGAPGICPRCTLLVRPIFSETTNGNGNMPSATPEELANAIVDSVQAGARVVNLSSALVQSSPNGERAIGDSLSYAASHGVIIVAAAGNQGTLGSSAITRHPWVIPVVACNWQGKPLGESNLGSSIGRRGLSAPGDGITSLGPNGKPKTFSGTSAAAPFVTGAIALLWSEFPTASATEIKLTAQSVRPRRATIAPPLLDAWASFQAMASVHPRRAS